MVLLKFIDNIGKKQLKRMLLEGEPVGARSSLRLLTPNTLLFHVDSSQTEF